MYINITVTDSKYINFDNFTQPTRKNIQLKFTGNIKVYRFGFQSYNGIFNLVGYK